MAIPETMTLDEFVVNPPEKMELIDGKLMEKDGMTLRYGEIQLRLGRYWGVFGGANCENPESVTRISNCGR